MYSKLFKIALLLALTLGINSLNFSAKADTALERCQLHVDSNSPGTCDIRGDECKCAHYINNLGTEECYICGPGGCQKQNNCDGCPENDNCEQPKKK